RGPTRLRGADHAGAADRRLRAQSPVRPRPRAPGRDRRAGLPRHPGPRPERELSHRSLPQARQAHGARDESIRRGRVSPRSKSFACDPTALSSGEREEHHRLADSLFGVIMERKELKDGYAFRLPPGLLSTLARWMAFECRCCPFFDFALTVAKDDGPMWLEVTGTKGIKD